MFLSRQVYLLEKILNIAGFKPLITAFIKHLVSTNSIFQIASQIRATIQFIELVTLTRIFHNVVKTT